MVTWIGWSSLRMTGVKSVAQFKNSPVNIEGLPKSMVCKGPHSGLSLLW